MPANDPVAAVIGEWMKKAENDLKNAANALKMGADCPTDTVCFHAQQCVEKYLKALLVLKGVAFPRSHSISTLMELIPPGMRPSLSLLEQNRLTEYATVTRYPGDYEPLQLSEARAAVKLARRVRSEARRFFPAEAHRERRK